MPVRALLLKQNWNFIQIRKSKEHYLDKVQQPFAGKAFRLVLCILLRYALIKRSTVEKKKQMIFFFFLVLSELLSIFALDIKRKRIFFLYFFLSYQGFTVLGFQVGTSSYHDVTGESPSIRWAFNSYPYKPQQASVRPESQPHKARGQNHLLSMKTQCKTTIK